MGRAQATTARLKKANIMQTSRKFPLEFLARTVCLELDLGFHSTVELPLPSSQVAQ